MNAHKKLKEIGFKRTRFHKPGFDKVTNEWTMLLDEEEIKYEYQDFKRISTTVKKFHPKSDSFWVLKYSDTYTLWALSKNHDISKIWLENKNGSARKWQVSKSASDERICLIFDLSSRESHKLMGKDQIINLLPKEVRRDFLLNQLFG